MIHFVYIVNSFKKPHSTEPVPPFPLRTKKRVTKQVVTLENLIKTTFGGERVNLLKVDIEGSEADLLAQDLSCLHQVDWIIIEWHKWTIQLEDVTTGLSKYCFTLMDVLKEDSICGLALFQNKNLAIIS